MQHAGGTDPSASTDKAQCTHIGVIADPGIVLHHHTRTDANALAQMGTV
jgi:hypothetical protein